MGNLDGQGSVRKARFKEGAVDHAPHTALVFLQNENLAQPNKPLCRRLAQTGDDFTDMEPPSLRFGRGEQTQSQTAMTLAAQESQGDGDVSATVSLAANRLARRRARVS